MWSNNYSEIWSSYSQKHSLGRFAEIIRQSIVPTAKCETADESGSAKLRPGTRMPERRKKKRAKPKQSMKPKRRVPPPPSYEMVGATSMMISQQMQMLGDGFDLSITNMIADNGNLAMGVQPDSFFTMKHNISFEGPFGYLMSGGGRDYTLECHAQNSKSSTFFANYTPSQSTIEGNWEQKYGYGLNSSFQFAVSTSEDPRMKLMLPSYTGKLQHVSSKHNINFGKNQKGEMYMSVFHRVLPSLCLGTKLAMKDLKGNGARLSFAGQYKMPPKRPGQVETIEAEVSAQAMKAIYSHQLSKHSTLIAKADINFEKKHAASSFMYKYLFGSENSGTQIMGEVTSGRTLRAIYMTPFLRQFMLRVHGEMDHFNADARLGKPTHKFGWSIMMQL